MFTGLIEEIGNIQEIKASDNSLYINIGCSKVLDGLKIGDSVAVNGACQTVISMDAKSFTVFASSETLNVTTFKNFKGQCAFPTDWTDILSVATLTD